MNIPTKEHFPALPLPEQVAQLARVDAKTRQDLILAARNSVDLTRALSVEMLFYTLKEIGLADAVSLLALASPEQVRDMMDLDCWRKDRLDDRRLLTWLMLLDEAGSGKLAEWCLHADLELLILLIKRYVEVVRKVEVEDDPHFDAGRYFTFDDQYLLRFVGEEEPILALLLERLRVLDYECYRNVLEQSLVELDSVLEEEELRWRNARLADRGYCSYEEALEVFRFVAPESLRLERYRRAALRPLRFAEGEHLIPADHALSLLTVPESFLLRALGALSPEDHEQIAQELASLTNQLVIAEACDPGELTEVRRCVELAHDYLNIGLAYMAQGKESEASRLLHETLLRPFFQVGVSLTLRLQQQAKQLDTTLREERIPGWETYLDTPFRETYAAVRRRPPLFFRGLETPGEILYRRFRTLDDVNRVATLLAQIPVWFMVMRRWGLLSGSGASAGSTLAVLWNTAYAHWIIQQKVEATPLSRAELLALQQRLREANGEETMAAFLTKGCTHLELTAEQNEALRTLAAHAAEKLQEALAVDIRTADLRFIGGVLVTA
jgi:hypothetical protein